MSCYYPLQAYFGALRQNGKRHIVFKPEEREFGSPFSLPCGRCIGCRLERSRQWAIRIMHEAKLYHHNSYLTLTYRDSSLPDCGSLRLEHFQLFMARFRKKYRSELFKKLYPEYARDNGIRFFHCGEYAPESRRPHYHACIFNADFPDRKFLKMNKSGEYKIYTSDILDAIWTHGHCFIGDVSFDSAAYVARYIVDKVTGDRAFEHYLDKDSGVMLKPEYTTMSKGVGKKWFLNYCDDVYPSDEVIVKGKAVPPPKYYDQLMDKLDSDLMANLKAKREMKAMKNSALYTREELIKAESVKLAQLNLFKRK